MKGGISLSENFVRWVRKQPVLVFYVLAFSITWLGWLPQTAHSHGLIALDSPLLWSLLYALGGVGPVLAAVIVMRVLRGPQAYGELFSPLLRWRVGAIWYIVALFGNVSLWLIVMGITGKLSTALEQVGPLLALLPLFLTNLLANVSEEVGWRGFVLPKLQTRYGALIASLIIGVLWMLWHLPLLLIKGSIMSTYPLIPYLIDTIALSVLYTWIYNSTRGSLLIVTLLHAAGNTVGAWVAPRAVITVLLAVIVVLVYGPARLSRTSEEDHQKAA